MVAGSWKSSPRNIHPLTIRRGPVATGDRHEFIGQAPEARHWYAEVADRSPQTKPGRRAAGAAAIGPQRQGSSNSRDRRWETGTS